MSDTPNLNPPEPKKELSTEMRLLIAFALMGIVLFATPYFFKSPAPPPAPKKAATAQQQNPVPETSAIPTAAKPEKGKTGKAKAETPPVEQVAAQKEENFVVETDFYKVVFSNRGAVAQQWILKKYTDDNGKPLELVNTAAAPKVGYPFALMFEQRKPSVDLDTALFVAKPDSDGLGVTYEYSNAGLTAHKTFRFQKDRWVTQVSTDVSEHGAPVPHLITWRGGFGDPFLANAGEQHTIYFDLNDAKLVTHDAKAAKNGPVTSEGNYSFAGVEDKFFTAVFIPASPPVKVITLADPVPTSANPKEEPHVGVAIGRSGQNSFSAFIGPKDLDILGQVNPQLVKIVDFGWFSFLAKPLFLALHYVNDKWVHSYGWSIIIVTIFINFLLFPLKFSNLKSMKKMQVLQPQVASINDKYKGISMRDPRAQQKNEELMALYKKHGANPMGGCLPMAIQIPFFIAFYKVLAMSIEMRHAHWLWVTDLSAPEHLPIHILPIAMIITSFIQQKMTPTTAADPNQQRMMLMMPLVMGFFFYQLASGLVLYYLTVNLVGIAQQWFFNKTVTIAGMPQPVAPVKKNGKIRR